MNQESKFDLVQANALSLAGEGKSIWLLGKPGNMGCTEGRTVQDHMGTKVCRDVSINVSAQGPPSDMIVERGFMCVTLTLPNLTLTLMQGTGKTYVTVEIVDQLRGAGKSMLLSVCMLAS